MTKRVRVENADNANYKVIVQIWEKAPQTAPAEQAPDSLVKEILLANPTDITGDDCYLTNSRYLVVKEAA